MYNLQFQKSIINIHEYYQTNHYTNDEFLKMIDKCFNIKRTTFYNWLNDNDIIYENNNKLINAAVETFIINLITNNKYSHKTRFWEKSQILFHFL